MPPRPNLVSIPNPESVHTPARSIAANSVSLSVEDAAHADFGLRLLAAAIDFAVLALFVAVVASFYSVAHHIPKQFTELAPGEAPGQVVRLFGAGFLRVLLVLYIACNWLYFAISESSEWQATLGKRIIGLCVTDDRRNRLTFLRASARFLGGRLLLHVPTMGIPYFLLDCIVAAFPPRYQALHDRMAACLVLKNPRPIEPI